MCTRNMAVSITLAFLLPHTAMAMAGPDHSSILCPVDTTTPLQTETLSYFNPDWTSNDTTFSLCPGETADTRFSPSQPMNPYKINWVTFVPSSLTGTDDAPFLISSDQNGLPAEPIFAQGGIPANTINLYSGQALQITLESGQYVTGDFHFAIGAGSAWGDTLALFADGGGGDPGRSLLWTSGAWFTMPQLGYSNSWIMEAQIQYQAVADEAPVVEILRADITPNPFRNAATIAYDLPHETRVEAAVYDLNGRLIRGLHSGFQSAGRYSIAWDGKTSLGRDVSPGVYVCRLTAGGMQQSYRMVLVD